MIEFHILPVHDRKASVAAGRPIFKDVEHIKIATPGSRDVVDRPVWDDRNNPRSDTVRFAKEYEAWREGKSTDVGTPLSQWPHLTASQIAELNHFNVKTVEQLAAIPDAQVQNFMGGHGLKKLAKDWLEAAAGAAPMVKMRSELEARDAELRALKEQQSKLVAQLEEQGEAISEFRKSMKGKAPRPE